MGHKYSKANTGSAEPWEPRDDWTVPGVRSKKDDTKEKKSDASKEQLPSQNEEELKESQDSIPVSLSAEALVKKAKEYIHQGNLLFRESRYNLARNRFSLALSILRGGHEIDSKHIATILNNLGIMEYAEGRYDEAKKLHEEALNIRKDISGSQELSSKSLQDTKQEGLESLVLKLKSTSTAHEKNENQDFISKLEEHSAFDAVVADSLNNVGACLVAQKEYDDARRFFLESCEIRKVIFGEKSIPVAESMENLATILDLMGNISEAESLLRSSLAIIYETLGADSLETATAENNLGVMLCKWKEAQNLLEHATVVREKILGASHHHTKSARQNLDYVLDKMMMSAQAAHTHTQKQSQNHTPTPTQIQKPVATSSSSPLSSSHSQPSTETQILADTQTPISPKTQTQTETETGTVGQLEGKSSSQPSDHGHGQEQEQEHGHGVQKQTPITTITSTSSPPSVTTTPFNTSTSTNTNDDKSQSHAVMAVAGGGGGGRSQSSSMSTPSESNNVHPVCGTNSSSLVE
eukprot:gene9396-19495_t